MNETIERMLSLLLACRADLTERVIDHIPGGVRGHVDRLTDEQRELVARGAVATRTAFERAIAARTDPEVDFAASVRDHERLRDVWSAADAIMLHCVRPVRPDVDTSLPALPNRPWRPKPPDTRDLVRGRDERLADREHDCHHCGPNGPCDC